MSKPFLQPVPEMGPQGQLKLVAYAERPSAEIGREYGCALWLAPFILAILAMIAKAVMA
jgi:hypothetical protein